MLRIKTFAKATASQLEGLEIFPRIIPWEKAAIKTNKKTIDSKLLFISLGVLKQNEFGRKKFRFTPTFKHSFFLFPSKVSTKAYRVSHDARNDTQKSSKKGKPKNGFLIGR